MGYLSDNDIARLKSLCSARDKLVDQWIAVHPDKPATRQQVVRYLAFGEAPEAMPTQLRRAQEALLRALEV